MKLIVLTGGISTGKSTVAKLLSQRYSIPVIDSDSIAHEIQQPGQKAYKQIIEHFGKTVVNDDGSINRKALGAIIFSNPAERRALNKITHPKVLFQLFKRSFICWIKGESIVVLDIPLFFEGSLPKWIFHEIITVSCDEQAQKERLIKRNTLSEDDATKRILSQLPLRLKRQKSTIVIDNNGSLQDLENNCESIVRNWKKKYNHIWYPHPLLVIATAVIIWQIKFLLQWQNQV